MTDAPPASRQELIKQYCSAADRTDWQAMLVATQELAAREQYDIAMEIRLAQKILATTTTRLTAVQSERGVAGQALEDARERAPLAIEQAPIVSNDPRMMTRATVEAYWRDVLPKLEQAVTAADRCYQDSAQAVAEAQERLDQVLVAAYARVHPVADAAAERRAQR